LIIFCSMGGHCQLDSILMGYVDFILISFNLMHIIFLSFLLRWKNCNPFDSLAEYIVKIKI
jgi:hypothetical protein